MPQLTLDQRYELSYLKKQQCTNSIIAEQLGVHPSYYKTRIVPKFR